MSRLDDAFRRFDAVNAHDPNTETVHGQPLPRELVYGQRMSARLAAFAADAPEAVQLAARAQHIRRWEVPRERYPEGRAGYLQWRTDLSKRHAAIAAAILEEVGYDRNVVERVQELLRKRGLKTDPEAQMIEDVACLVFFEHYFHDFAPQHDEEKLIRIVQKTWTKMSEKAREAARRLDYAPEDRALIQRALQNA